jgi:hypothetical protein
MCFQPGWLRSRSDRRPSTKFQRCRAISAKASDCCFREHRKISTAHSISENLPNIVARSTSRPRAKARAAAIATGASREKVLRDSSSGGSLSASLSFGDLSATAARINEGLEVGPISRSTLHALLVLAAFPTDGGYRALADVAKELEYSPSTAHRHVSTWMAIGAYWNRIRDHAGIDAPPAPSTDPSARPLTVPRPGTGVCAAGEIATQTQQRALRRTDRPRRPRSVALTARSQLDSFVEPLNCPAWSWPDTSKTPPPQFLWIHCGEGGRSRRLSRFAADQWRELSSQPSSSPPSS